MASSTAAGVIDSAVLIAAFLRRDARHADASPILYAADEGDIGPLLVTDYILAETLNFLQRKGTPDMAREVLRRLEASSGFRIERLPDSVYAAARHDVYPRYPTLSFVDACTVALMAHQRLTTLYSYDSGFDAVASLSRMERLRE